MLVEQIIEFELRGPGYPGRTCRNSFSGLLFTAEILQKAMCLTSPYMDQITYNKILHHNARF